VKSRVERNGNAAPTPLLHDAFGGIRHRFEAFFPGARFRGRGGCGLLRDPRRVYEHPRRVFARWRRGIGLPR
jgi:hypothetical protein